MMRVVAFAHRWLGIVGGLLFIAWFASGVVMMYARMPQLSQDQRLALMPGLDLSSAALGPADAAGRQHLAPQRATVTTVTGRPAYRFVDRGRTAVVSADSGERFDGLSQDAAVAQAFNRARDTAAIRYDTRITEPDQWTLQSRALLPMHRIDLGAGRVAYVSDVTGQLALLTDARERRIAYAGAVLHWLYFTPVRRNGPFWNQLIIWLSIAGSVMCLLGLVWGVWIGWRSPYRGWMWWHHTGGLVFGLVTFTWIFTGPLLSGP